MNGIRLLLVIIKRENEPDYQAFLKREGMPAVFTTLCHGTAGQTILSLWGLEKTDKILLTTMADGRKASALMQKMISSMGINVPGNGIALTVPIESIGGASAMKYLMERQNYIIEEGSPMSNPPVFHYHLIVAITERGHAEMVMGAARTAGAGGGTIVHAKGAGTEFTAAFFGVSIAAEKDVVLIVVGRSDKEAVMRAIMEQAGIRSEAHTALFSMPVEDVAGLTSVMNAEADTAEV